LASAIRGEASPDVVTQVFREHGARLVGRVALVVGDLEEARDIAQQAFVLAMEQGPTGSGVDLARWLSVVSMRLAINERRRRRRWGFLPLSETVGTWAIETDPDLWRALLRLDRRTRATLVLTVLDGYSQQEVAAALGVPRGTVAGWLATARTRLRSDIKVVEG
jgi:RNA polymerase sigma factor (sigma-70 family)